MADYIKWMSGDQANFYNIVVQDQCQISDIGPELQFGHVSLCLINKITIKTTVVYGLLLNNTAFTQMNTKIQLCLSHMFMIYTIKLHD